MTASVAALTFSQLDTQVRNLLNDNINFIATSPESLSAQTWDEDMMAEALNFAVKEYCRSTDVTYLETTINVDGYGFATLPADRLELQRVFYPAGGAAGVPYYTIDVTPTIATAPTFDQFGVQTNAPTILTVTINRFNGHNKDVTLVFPIKAELGDGEVGIYINSPNAEGAQATGLYYYESLQSGVGPFVIPIAESETILHIRGGSTAWSYFAWYTTPSVIVGTDGVVSNEMLISGQGGA